MGASTLELSSTFRARSNRQWVDRSTSPDQREARGDVVLFLATLRCFGFAGLGSFYNEIG